jgi:hypothetical protein
MCLFVAARVSGTFGKHRKTEKPKRNDQINYWLRFFVWSSLLKVLAVLEAGFNDGKLFCLV